MAYDVSEVGKRIQQIVVTLEERKSEILKLEGEINTKRYEMEKAIEVLEEKLKKKREALEQARTHMKVELGKFDPHILNGAEKKEEVR